MTDRLRIDPVLRMAVRYQHVLDSIRKGVADQVGGLLWDAPEPGRSAADGQDNVGDEGRDEESF